VVFEPRDGDSRPPGGPVAEHRGGLAREAPRRWVSSGVRSVFSQRAGPRQWEAETVTVPKFPVLTKRPGSALAVSSVTLAKSGCCMLHLHFIVCEAGKRVLRVYGMMGFNNERDQWQESGKLSTF